MGSAADGRRRVLVVPPSPVRFGSGIERCWNGSRTRRLGADSDGGAAVRVPSPRRSALDGERVSPGHSIRGRGGRLLQRPDRQRQLSGGKLQRTGCGTIGRQTTQLTRSGHQHDRSVDLKVVSVYRRDRHSYPIVLGIDRLLSSRSNLYSVMVPPDHFFDRSTAEKSLSPPL